jgi:hypothetical protein
MNDLKQMLISSGSELRFTIKMSREEYKSLLEFKSKMNKQKVWNISRFSFECIFFWIYFIFFIKFDRMKS